MCGIVALHRAGTSRDAEAMLERIVHRGPDDCGTVTTGESVLGARRLSIIDVAGGHQPLSSEDEQVWVSFNGEIYNHRDLARELAARGHRFRSAADTEVLVHGYEEWGWEGLLARLRGMFAFALADAHTGALWLGRDRLGVKPLYLTRVGAGWAAASEIKALFAHPAIAPQLDESRLPEALANRFVSGDRTAFANVMRLPPGGWLKLQGERAEAGRYWEVPSAAQELPCPAKELPAVIRSLVEEAVRLRLIADVPLGALLSGGLDSSIVVAAMVAAGSQPVRTFTVGFEPAEGDERAAARTVAAHLRTDHVERVASLDAADLLETVVWHLDEPVGDAAALPTLLICRAARERVTVVLTGEGADELFLGYPRYLLSRLADRAMRCPAPLRHAFLGAAAHLVGGRARLALTRLAEASPDALLRNALWMSGAEPATVAALTRCATDGWERWYVPETGSGDSPGHDLGAVLARDLAAWLVNDVLLKVDKMSMAASLEARTPFLDHLLVEFVARLPLAVRFRARDKRWLRHAFRGALPAGTLGRAKHAFRPPVAAWFRGALGTRLEALAAEPGGFTARYLDRGTLRSLLGEHRRGRDHALLLWSVLVHEVWWRKFFA